MKIGCKIIQDILPLYVENIASDETREFVETHLVDCGNCRDLLNGMKDPSDIPITLSAAPLIHLKKKMFKKRMITVLVTAVVVLIATVIGFIYLTTPRYLPFYDTDVSTITGEEHIRRVTVTVMDETYLGGGIMCYFSDGVTGFSYESYWSEDGMTEVYRITAWYTVLDRITGRNSGKQLFINPPSINEGKLFRIYYNPNDGTEDVFIYGNAPLGSGIG